MEPKEAAQVILEMGLNTLKYRLKLAENHKNLFNHFDSIGDYTSKLDVEFSLIHNFKRMKKIVLAITSFVDRVIPGYRSEWDDKFYATTLWFNPDNLKEFKETDWLGWYKEIFSKKV